MKKIIIALSLIVAIAMPPIATAQTTASTIGNTSAQPFYTSIKVTSPTAGDELKVGKKYTIKWEGSASGVDDVSLHLLMQKGEDKEVMEIGKSKASKGSFKWKIPKDLASKVALGNGFAIELRGKAFSTQSANFAIVSSHSSSNLGCTLKTDKSSYVVGEPITFTWKSKNAKYAAFVKDTSGKDTLTLPGDKFAANGSTLVQASVIGNPVVTLLVGGKNNKTATCTVTVHIVSGTDTRACTKNWDARADFNNDGLVNFSDLLIHSQNNGKTANELLPGDANKDGIVNHWDMVIVTNAYNSCRPK